MYKRQSFPLRAYEAFFIFGGLSRGFTLCAVSYTHLDVYKRQPLYSHALPAGAELVTKEAKKDDAGVMTAALLLACDTDENTLLAFYSDVDYPDVYKRQPLIF